MQGRAVSVRPLPPRSGEIVENAAEIVDIMLAKTVAFCNVSRCIHAKVGRHMYVKDGVGKNLSVFDKFYLFLGSAV